MQVQGRLQLAAYLAPPLAILVVVVAISCTRDSIPSPTATSVDVAANRALPGLNAKQLDRLNGSKARTRWVGDAHHAAMQVVIAEIVKHKKAKRSLPKKGSAEYCAILENAGDAALSVIDSHRGLNRGRAERAAQIRQQGTLAECFGGLSVFGPSPSTYWPPARMTFQDSDPEVTGAYELYLTPMDAAVRQSDGSVYSVQTGLDAVLVNALSAGIPDGDLLALTSFANLAVSSAVEWNDFDWSIANERTCTTGCDAMSVFGTTQSGGQILSLIGIDGLGCFSTVTGWGALKALLGAPAWVALAGQCGFRGALASAGGLMAMAAKK
jgi:hypothetical protein